MDLGWMDEDASERYSAQTHSAIQCVSLHVVSSHLTKQHSQASRPSLFSEAHENVGVYRALQE
jgi:hypothetical protein